MAGRRAGTGHQQRVLDVRERAAERRRGKIRGGGRGGVVRGGVLMMDSVSVLYITHGNR